MERYSPVLNVLGKKMKNNAPSRPPRLTEKLLKRPSEIVITDKSGSDGIYLCVNNFLGLHGKDRIKKTKLIPIARWVVNQYDVENRTTAISDREMVDLVKEHLPEQYKKAAEEGHLVYTHHEE